MDPFNYEGGMRREEFVKWCVADRDQLTEEFFILRPDNEGSPPSLWVEELLEVLGYKVCYQPMSPNQLGLYDAQNGLIFVNSKLNNGRRDADLRRRSTLAYELSHTRLHAREMQERAFADFNGDHYETSRSRSRNRETEAYLYAAMFLVPRAQLESQEAAQLILESRHCREQLSPDVLKDSVGTLARAFYVSPAFMRRCLIDLGWLKRTSNHYHLELDWSTAYD